MHAGSEYRLILSPLRLLLVYWPSSAAGSELGTGHSLLLPGALSGGIQMVTGNEIDFGASNNSLVNA